MTLEEKRNLVAKQCSAVAYLAQTLADIYAPQGELFLSGSMDATLDLVGSDTAGFMEKLGDMMEAAGIPMADEDEWLVPIFEEAQRRWPGKP